MYTRFIILFAICISYADFAYTHGIQKKINHHNKIEPNLTPYLLPEDHPLQSYLSEIFINLQMFKSPNHLKKEGFEVKTGHKQLMVGFHPSIPEYAIKKFTDRVPQKIQLENYIRRIEGAKYLQNYIQEHHFKHLVVPKKWLYKLPKAFSRNKEDAYILIVENMHIYDDWNDPNGEAKRLYYQMDREMLTELCTLLYEVGGCDAYPWNQPFTHEGKIAFIDTEHVGKIKFHDYFIRHIVPCLNEELQAYASALWAQLAEQHKP